MEESTKFRRINTRKISNINYRLKKCTNYIEELSKLLIKIGTELVLFGKIFVSTELPFSKRKCLRK